MAVTWILAACAAAPATTTAGIGNGGDDLRVILEVRDEGGFVPVEFSIGRMPTFVLMSDGTLYGPGMTTLEFPGKLLPSVQATTVGEAAMSDILQYIEDIGMADIIKERNDDAMAQIADAPDTVVTYYDEDAHEFSVYALGMSTTNADVRIALLSELVERLHMALGEGLPQPHYQPDRIEVLAGVQEIPVDPQFDNQRGWPIGVAFADMVEAGAGWRCSPLEGEAKDAALAVFDAANAATSWNDGQTTYTIVVRYLYPHQAACGTVG